MSPQPGPRSASAYKGAPGHIAESSGIRRAKSDEEPSHGSTPGPPQHLERFLSQPLSLFRRRAVHGDFRALYGADLAESIRGSRDLERQATKTRPGAGRSFMKGPHRSQVVEEAGSGGIRSVLAVPAASFRVSESSILTPRGRIVLNDEVEITPTRYGTPTGSIGLLAHHSPTSPRECRSRRNCRSYRRSRRSSRFAQADGLHADRQTTLPLPACSKEAPTNRASSTLAAAPPSAPSRPSMTRVGRGRQPKSVAWPHLDVTGRAGPQVPIREIAEKLIATRKPNSRPGRRQPCCPRQGSRVRPLTGVRG